MLLGDGLDIDFLDSEDISDIDCFIALTESEQTNLLSSMIAKDFGVKQVITHVNATDYYKVIKKMDLSIVVSKNISAVNEILKYIRTEQENVEISRFEDLDVEAVELTVGVDCGYMRKDSTISDIPDTISLSAIIRNNEVMIPNYKTQILPNDQLLIFAKPNEIKEIESLFR
jgi:trk system potassium uptake protein TrkA